jgi:5-methylthioadenosine/S-adenosylhomocysteine deaminase
MIVVTARWVLPVAAAPIRDGAVGIEGERIAWVGPAADAPNAPRTNLGDAILMPGLVNAHTHLDLTLFRGLLEGLDFFAWIRTLTTAKREVTTDHDLLDAARAGIAEGLAAGITTYGDTSDKSAAFDAMLEAGVRGVAYQEVFGPDPAQCTPSVNDLRARIARLRPRETSRVLLGVSPHAPYSVSDPLFADVADFARAEQLPIAVHIAESAAETELVAEGRGPFADFLRGRGIAVAPRAASPIALLERTGILAERPLLIHAIRADAADRAAVARAGAAVAHCPCSNAKLGHGVAPLREWRDAGVTVAFGSDSMASNNRMHLLEEARTAALQQASRLARPDAVTSRELLQMATQGGADALGLGALVGSIEPGKCADLAAFPLGMHGAAADFDPEAHAIYALGGTAASWVAVDGEVLVADGVPARRDDGLPVRLDSATKRLVEWRQARLSV